MSHFRGSFRFHSADTGGAGRRERIDPGKVLDLIARIKSASGTPVSAAQPPAQTKPKAG